MTKVVIKKQDFIVFIYYYQSWENHYVLMVKAKMNLNYLKRMLHIYIYVSRISDFFSV
jgi:hypothetical protein